MNGCIVAKNPCITCTDKKCDMCELDMYRRGTLSNPQWISVDERLPEENGRYLVCVNVSHQAFENILVIAVLDYDMSHGFYVFDEKNECPTHWMPLPEAPEMKGGAE